MSTITSEDVIKAASSVARDIADGKLAPDALERQAIQELSALLLIEPEPGSDLEALQAESARRVLARSGIPTDELAEWLAVQRRRENPDADKRGQGCAELADGADVLAEVSSDASVAHSGENDGTPADADPDLVEVPAALVSESEPGPAASVGCKCGPAPIQRGPRGGTVLAAGRGLPTDNGLRPL